MLSGVTKLPKWISAPTSSTMKMTNAANVGISDARRSRKVRT